MKTDPDHQVALQALTASWRPVVGAHLFRRVQNASWGRGASRRSSRSNWVSPGELKPSACPWESRYPAETSWICYHPEFLTFECLQDCRLTWPTLDLEEGLVGQVQPISLTPPAAGRTRQVFSPDWQTQTQALNSNFSKHTDLSAAGNMLFVYIHETPFKNQRTIKYFKK